MDVSGQLRGSASLSPPKRLWYAVHWIGGCVGPRVALDALAPPIIEPLLNLHFQIIAEHSSPAPLYHIYCIYLYGCSAASHTTIIIFSFLTYR
jgi:hypothetical protein